jgi:hypothetical protein
MVAELTGEGSSEAGLGLGERLCRWVSGWLSVLENNEECRLGWVVGGRGRAERGGRMDIRMLEGEVEVVKKLREECRYGVGSKS